MELTWMNIIFKEPPTIGKEYLVTVQNQYWDKPKVMIMLLEIEVVRGRQKNIWKFEGRKKPSTWEVTHWMEMPNPAEEG